MTAKQLQVLCDYWSDRLNLKEWKISVRWGSAKEMKGVVGSCLWHTEELKASVLILQRAPLKESILVHELLHIVIQGHEELKSAYDVHLERAINRLTDALMEGQIQQ